MAKTAATPSEPGDPGTVPVDVWLDEQDRPRRMVTSRSVGDGTVVLTMEWFDYGRAVDVTMPTGCRDLPRDEFDRLSV